MKTVASIGGAIVIGFLSWVGNTTYNDGQQIASNSSRIDAVQSDMGRINNQLDSIDNKIDYLIGFRVKGRNGVN